MEELISKARVLLEALPFTGRLSPEFQRPVVTGFLLLDTLLVGRPDIFWDAIKHMLLPSFAVMWVAGQGFWYYLVSYVLFELVYAMEIIPYETLAAEMSPNYKTKAKFAGARIICGQIANIAALWLPGVIVAPAMGKVSR